MQPKVLFSPSVERSKRVFAPETLDRLCAQFNVTRNVDDRDWSIEELTARLPGQEALVTSWGARAFTNEALEAADRLKVVAHAAGSVKYFFTEEQLERYIKPRGITVVSANAAIAINVAEFTLGLMLLLSRRMLELVEATRQGAWSVPAVADRVQGILGATVGIVGASTVGREVIRLLQPWDCRVLVYDPYLSEEAAERLGVTRCDLETLLSRSDFVSMHTPQVPETDRMLTAERLRLIRDGACLINTARPRVLDPDALLAEARTGRFSIALDVTEPEPLPAEHPLRELPNVYITPHRAGNGRYGYDAIGKTVCQGLEDHFAGRPVKGAVDLSRWALLA